MRRWVRLGVIANDLLALATKTVTRCHPRGSVARRAKDDEVGNHEIAKSSRSENPRSGPRLGVSVHFCTGK